MISQPARMPILWAHRGASALAPENTLAAFSLAVRLGASGIESDVRLARDGTAVLVHDARVERAGRRTRIASADAAELSALGIPTLRDLYAAIGLTVPLSLDLKGPDPDGVADAVIAVARDCGGEAAIGRLHLCVDDAVEVLTLAAARRGPVWVHSSGRSDVAGGIAAHAARLADGGVTVLNLKRTLWGPARHLASAVGDVHRRGLRAFAWDTQLVRDAERFLAAGIDGLYADDPRVLVEAARSQGRA
jgi:glycerophosphoryl diester phosphodiesterase